MRAQREGSVLTGLTQAKSLPRKAERLCRVESVPETDTGG